MTPKLNRSTTLAFGCLAFLSGTANAALLGSGEIRNLGGVQGVFSQQQVIVSLTDSVSNPLTTLFNFQLNAASAGQTLTLDSGTAFNVGAAVLTNGLNDQVDVSYINNPFIGHSASQTEPRFFSGVGLHGVDFAGSTITSVELAIHTVTFASPGDDPNHDGVWTNYNFDATLNVFGAPEPSTFALAALGLVGMLILLAQNMVASYRIAFSEPPNLDPGAGFRAASVDGPSTGTLAVIGCAMMQWSRKQFRCSAALALTVAVFAVQPTLLRAGNVLVLYATPSGPIYTQINQNVPNELQITGRIFGTVDTFDATGGTPSPQLLASYQSVLYYDYAQSPLDPSLLGDRLADYVDHGGGVVRTFTESLGGRWASQHYDPLQPGGVSIIAPPQKTSFPTNQAIFQDVHSLQGQIHDPFTALAPGATLLADWQDPVSNGHLAAELHLGLGRVVALDFVAWSLSGNQFTGWSGDGGILLANSLNHVAPEPSAFLLATLGFLGLLISAFRRPIRDTLASERETVSDGSQQECQANA